MSTTISRRRFFGKTAACAAFASTYLHAEDPSKPAKGPLRVHPKNPRYFTADGDRAIYLTGSHTWSSLQDCGLTDPPPAFDFDGYLNFLEKHHHNFIRLWRWETPRWTEHNRKQVKYGAVHPWKRVGPAKAADGKPKFDLKQFDPEFFKRLRERVAAAGKRGIYVSIMLFEGWELSFASFDCHPFNSRNNVNGVHGDPNGDGKGREINTLAIPAVTAIQDAYVKKVIDAVNDLDNVLYENINESGLYSTDWQYRMIRFIKDYEKKKPKQHPVGMTSDGYGGDDDTDRLFKSPADWISPSPDRDDYKGNPPANTGAKVILLDTDHLWGVGGDRAWVWKSFLRGHNPIWMDPYKNPSVWESVPANAEDVRRNLGAARRFAERMNLAAMTPANDLASSKYCLANPGHEYLVYLPTGGAVTVDLSKATGAISVEWHNPATGKDIPGHPVTGGAQREFKAPFKGDAVLYLVRLKVRQE